MRELGSNKVWVSGQRYNVDYLIDTSSGEVVKRLTLPQHGGVTAGVGRPCGRQFVAIYVDPQSRDLLIQVGAHRRVIDDQIRVEHRRRLGGLVSELTVFQDGEPSLSARLFVVSSVLQKRVDPAYDDEDELADDFLADVADIVSSKPRQELIRETKDPSAGPWLMVSDDFAG